MSEDGHTPESVQDWLGYLTKEELDALTLITLSLPFHDCAVVNLGAGGGTSGLTFAYHHPNLQLWTVDVTDKSDPRGCLEGERAVMISAGLWPDPRLNQIHGDSTDAGIRWSGPPLDLVFHDSDHTYEKVKADIRAWLPHLKQDGLFVFHDYGDHRHVGVKPAADEELADLDLETLVGRIAAFRNL